MTNSALNSLCIGWLWRGWVGGCWFLECIIHGNCLEQNNPCHQGLYSIQCRLILSIGSSHNIRLRYRMMRVIKMEMWHQPAMDVIEEFLELGKNVSWLNTCLSIIVFVQQVIIPDGYDSYVLKHLSGSAFYCEPRSAYERWFPCWMLSERNFLGDYSRPSICI